MKIISKQDEGIFLSLFIRNGYVLDFTTNNFDVFTMDSIGIPLCEKYKLSKGKSLVSYLDNATDQCRTKLLSDLFNYYEENMECEYNKYYKQSSWSGENHKYVEKYAKAYEKCKAIINKLSCGSEIISEKADNLKDKFSSEYMSQQIELMKSMQSTNPTSAIGLAKELIESCCKTILDELGIGWNKRDDISQLTNKTMDALNLLPQNIIEKDSGTDALKAVLGNLRAIPIKLAELRNAYGSGHGKSSSFQGLEIRHAKLAVGCSVTFVDFIWDTYENI